MSGNSPLHGQIFVHQESSKPTQATTMSDRQTDRQTETNMAPTAVDTADHTRRRKWRKLQKEREKKWKKEWELWSSSVPPHVAKLEGEPIHWRCPACHQCQKPSFYFLVYLHTQTHTHTLATTWNLYPIAEQQRYLVSDKKGPFNQCRLTFNNRKRHFESDPNHRLSLIINHCCYYYYCNEVVVVEDDVERRKRSSWGYVNDWFCNSCRAVNADEMPNILCRCRLLMGG